MLKLRNYAGYSHSICQCCNFPKWIINIYLFHCIEFIIYCLNDSMMFIQHSKWLDFYPVSKNMISIRTWIYNTCKSNLLHARILMYNGHACMRSRRHIIVTVLNHRSKRALTEAVYGVWITVNRCEQIVMLSCKDYDSTQVIERHRIYVYFSKSIPYVYNTEYLLFSYIEIYSMCNELKWKIFFSFAKWTDSHFRVSATVNEQFEHIFEKKEKSTLEVRCSNWEHTFTVADTRIRAGSYYSQKKN